MLTQQLKRKANITADQFIQYIQLLMGEGTMEMSLQEAKEQTYQDFRVRCLMRGWNEELFQEYWTLVNAKIGARMG
jgi:hypothetical protein